MSDVAAPTSAPAPVNTQEAAKADPKKLIPGQAVAGAAGGETLGDIAKEVARKRKLKDDQGQEFEVDESELEKTYISRKAHQREANKKLQEGLAARKQAEEFISMMKNPAKFYETAKKLGHDPRKLAEEYLAAQLEDELMDPRERELRDTKKKLQSWEELDKAQKKQAEEKLHTELKTKFAKEYSDQFVKALETSGLPPTKPMVAEIAKYIQRSAKIGFKMSAEEAATLVKEDLQTRMQRLIGDTDGETLIKLLGDDVANKVRKWDTSRIKDPNQFIKTPETQGERSTRTRSADAKRMSPSEWRKFNRS